MLDSDRRASCRTQATRFWRQIGSLETKRFIFFTFLQAEGFLEIQILFREYLMPSPERTVQWPTSVDIKES